MKKVEIIIILIFHSEKSFQDSLECIESLMKIDEPSFNVLIVNNGAIGNYEKIIKEKNPDTIYLFSNSNLGFAGANNLGLEYGIKNNYKYFLILNSDTIVDKYFLYHLLNKLKSDDKIGMVGPKTLYYNEHEKIWAMGGYIIKWRAIVAGLNEQGRAVSEYLSTRLFLRSNHYDEVDYLPASCILVKKEVIEKIGFLSEAYFFAYEEAEFALKAKKVGYKIVVEPQSVIWHKVGMSNKWTDELIYNSYRNRLLFLRRNYISPINYLLILILTCVKFTQPKTQKVILYHAFVDTFKYNKITYEHLLAHKK